jgi:pSer/pThr/pTyr-binding forkhead associated (FHA) protein
MKICLVVADGPHKGKTIPITLAQFIIGRDPQCQLRPASSMISRRHCAVLVRENKVYLRDFGSTNGTLVNDKRVEGEVELHHGDRIVIDPLNFEIHMEAGRSAPPPRKESSESEDESIAALLLEMGQDGAEVARDSDVPEGSTVHQLQALPEDGAAAPAEEKSRAGDKADKIRAEQASTSAAAKLLLEKYARRRRP